MHQHINTEAECFLDFFTAVGVDGFEIFTGDHCGIAAFDSNEQAQDTALSSADVRGILAELEEHNRAGLDVYIRPSRRAANGTEMAWPVILLDDIDATESLEFVGLYSAISIQTAPGRSQVWVAVDRPLTLRQRGEVQQWILRHLVDDGHAGASTGAGRLPGFYNCEPGCGDRPIQILASNTTGPAMWTPKCFKPLTNAS